MKNYVAVSILMTLVCASPAAFAHDPPKTYVCAGGAEVWVTSVADAGVHHVFRCTGQAQSFLHKEGARGFVPSPVPSRKAEFTVYGKIDIELVGELFLISSSYAGGPSARPVIRAGLRCWMPAGNNFVSLYRFREIQFKRVEPSLRRIGSSVKLGPSYRIVSRKLTTRPCPR